jgi:CRP-like cAMP-binding protein
VDAVAPPEGRTRVPHDSDGGRFRSLTPVKLERMTTPGSSGYYDNFAIQSTMTIIATHPERNIIRVQLGQNHVLKALRDSEKAALEPHLVVVDCNKGDILLRQGVHEMEQYFILDGILKRVVTNQQAKEMILRFTVERDIESSYAAWCLKTPTPYSIVCVTKARVAKLPLPVWVAFMESHSEVKQRFEFEVMQLMSEIMGHTITLHLLDAPGRVHRFLRKHPDLYDRMPKKELAAYLNLSPETLSRLKHQGKI